MRIAHIAHGRIPIPPTASGAVEAIISDYQFHCEKFGHEFLVVNDLSPVQAMMETEAFRPDIAHLHDESKIDAFAVLNAPIKIVTTHDPTFFEKPNPFISRFVRGDFFVGCLSDDQRLRFMMHGVPPHRCLKIPNGARSDLIRATTTPNLPDTIVCLGMIGQRKRQHLLFDFPFVQCVGPVSTYDPVETGGREFEEWTKHRVHIHLSDYAALVLLSKSEADPLVVKEALMAGLDVIVSEAASANLDRSQPFVHVLDEKVITNPLLLEIALTSVLKHHKDRAAVRAYAEQHFDWSILVMNYLSSLFYHLKAAA